MRPIDQVALIVFFLHILVFTTQIGKAQLVQGQFEEGSRGTVDGRVSPDCTPWSFCYRPRVEHTLARNREIVERCDFHVGEDDFCGEISN